MPSIEEMRRECRSILFNMEDGPINPFIVEFWTDEEVEDFYTEHTSPTLCRSCGQDTGDYVAMCDKCLAE